MSVVNRKQGRYSPAEGFQLPAEGFKGKALVPCPSGISPEARKWWRVWATSQYAHFFGPVEWQDLADTARLMDRFYAEGSPRHMAEARQHAQALFGLATRARLHVTEEELPATVEAPVSRSAARPDPRLKAV